MLFLECLFWFCVFIIFFNYAGYALVAYLFSQLRRRKRIIHTAELPSISFIVAAFNEEDCIEKKIINSLEQDYPSDRIEFIFVSDGSSDATPDIISRYSRIKLLHQPQRGGKSAALNRAVKAAKNEVLIFSDANTLLNKKAVRIMAAHYADPIVGGVSGEKKVLVPTYSADEVVNSEGLYWKYESTLKKIDSDFWSVVGAAGELFSVRRELYEPLPHHVILDDFLLSMKVALKGFRIIYEPKAFATELPSFSVADEHKRKVRIAAGGFQAISMLPRALQFWKHWKLSFLYISHRVLRWAVTPFCLVLALVTNFVLAADGAFLYLAILALQLAFYASALVLHLFPGLGKTAKPLKLSYYFVFMNISVIQGFFRFLRRNQPSTWEKARRSEPGLLEHRLIDQ